MSKRILVVFGFGCLAITAAVAQNFNRFTFNAGGGFGIGFHDVSAFTNHSYQLTAGGGVNLRKAFGVKAEYMYYNLAFKSSVINQQSLPGAGGHIQSVTLNPFFNFPISGRWGAYAVGGGGWYQRSVSANSQTLVPGTTCQPAWVWWEISCSNNVVVTQQTLSSHSVSSGGYNFGGGITYRFKRYGKFYVEARYHHSNSGGDSHTSILPVTVGWRW